MHYTNEQIKQDIINEFINLTKQMSSQDRKIPRTSLSNLSANQMVKHLQKKSEIGLAFVAKMLGIGYARATNLQNKPKTLTPKLPN